uniref:Major facilitator superfamily (MFS) profile domain-containing protein n=1 Tax=Alexandrium catenella TaxID=2925 RepID=A0A7S1S6D5_ALECA
MWSEQASSTSGVRWDQIIGIGIFITAVAFAIFSIKDVHQFIMLLMSSGEAQSMLVGGGETQGTESGGSRARSRSRSSEALAGRSFSSKLEEDESSPVADDRPEWSIMGLVLLTSYRFFTGFMSATWLPYLLAMEGEYLFPEKQALFMALAKLVYGTSILLNPIFGFIGDGAVGISHGVGRRLFIRIGLSLAVIGLYICVLSGRDQAFLSFLSGVLVWRLGEALNDVTTEALVPEMVHPKQFKIASAIKASSFLLGGLLGYVLLMLMTHVRFTWLYYAYPVGMFICSLPPLYLLNQNRPIVHAKMGHEEQTFLQSMAQAYVDPCRYPGGFPYACLAVCVFSLGTAPMFYMLLIVRDLVGFTDPANQQFHFSVVSIIFFLSAAVASCVVALIQRAKPDGNAIGRDNGSGGEEGAPESTGGAPTGGPTMRLKGPLLAWSMTTFGLTVLAMPFIALIPSLSWRSGTLMCLALVLGGAFGVAFTLFQDMTWQLLPLGVRVANAMGFSVMCRLFGIGIGNFISGLLLDMAYSDALGQYKVWGYFVMHSFSAICVFISVPIASSVIRMVEEGELQPLKAPTA